MDAGRPEDLTTDRRRLRVADADVAARIIEIDSRLQREDPGFARTFRRLERGDRLEEVAIFALLAMSALLLAVAVVHLAWPAGLAGVVAYAASFAVDHRRRRRRGRSRRQ